MQVIELSNHPGDMLTDVSRRRQAAGQRAQARYDDALVQHQARVQTIRVQRDRARRSHRWWTWLRLVFAVWAEQRRMPVQRVVVLTHRRSRLGSGHRPTVHVGTSTGYVLSLVRDSAGELSDRQRAEVQRLIRRDHEFHERRRR
jgi:hypothetical protein